MGSRPRGGSQISRGRGRCRPRCAITRSRQGPAHIAALGDARSNALPDPRLGELAGVQQGGRCCWAGVLTTVRGAKSRDFIW